MVSNVEVAGFLLLLVLVLLVCTVLSMTRLRDFSRRFEMLEDVVKTQGHMIANIGGTDVTELPTVSAADFSKATEILGKASPEDLAAASKLMSALGLDKD